MLRKDVTQPRAGKEPTAEPQRTKTDCGELQTIPVGEGDLWMNSIQTL